MAFAENFCSFDKRDIADMLFEMPIFPPHFSEASSERNLEEISVAFLEIMDGVRRTFFALLWLRNIFMSVAC